MFTSYSYSLLVDCVRRDTRHQMLCLSDPTRVGNDSVAFVPSCPGRCPADPGCGRSPAAEDRLDLFRRVDNALMVDAAQFCPVEHLVERPEGLLDGPPRSSWRVAFQRVV